MECQIKAATIKKTIGPHGTRYVVIIDKDAAEIMGETKTRYVYDSLIGAERFAKVLQDNLQAAFDDACA